ncbi:hypothetical protein [Haliovirga abyssi]|uniref:Mechanosensitive ion channel MscS porin domain-containing protein n=1 Tax=Haliovirga abyssi TaxID=2996794 RepID=A0AAU9E015_9FUSO|nr:hypothetical protein [Haliovirga abyssi]BDU51200.1 hypothetical protein HLVA_17690 [Haliovirga abyssi]
MLKKLLIFIMLSLNIYSSQLDILQEQYKKIKNSLEKLKILKEKSWSDTNYLKLKRDLVSKNLEIIKEENKKLKEKFQIESELEKLDKISKILKSKLKEYEKKKQIMEKNQEVVSKMDILNIKYNIFSLKEQIESNIRAKNYNVKKLKDISNLKLEKIKNIKKEIEKSYKILEAVYSKELNLANQEKLGAKEIDNREINLKLVRLQREEDLKNIDKTKDKLKKDLADNISDLKVLESKLNILELEKEMLVSKSKVGLASKTELFDKDMEYLNKVIEKLDYESKIEYLKLELAE